MGNDGSVVIKAILDTNDVSSGVTKIDNSLKRVTWKDLTTGTDKAQALGKSFQGAGAMMTAGITVPLVMAGQNAFQAASDFESSMSRVAGALDDPAVNMQELSDLALQMGADTIFGAVEAGNAMEELAKGGLTAADIKAGALQSTMNLAAAGGLGLADSANVVVQAMGAFGLSADEVDVAVNALAGSAAASSADVADLTQGLSQVSAQAHSAGWSVQDTTAVLGAFADAGIIGSDAGTSLKTMLQRLAAPTDTAADAIDALGINIRDADGNMKDAQGVAQELTEKLGGLSSAEKDAAMQTIFGSDASRAALVMTNLGAEGIGRYTEATNDQTAAQRLADSQMGDSERAMEEMNGSLETLAITIGQTLAPVISEFAGIIGGLAEWFSGLPQPVQLTIIALAGLLAIAGPILLIVGTFITMLPTLAAGFAALTGPIGLAIAAVAAVIAILVTLYNENEEFRQFVDETWAAIQQAFWDAVNGIGGAIEEVIGFFSWLGEGLDGLIAGFSEFGTSVNEGWNQFKQDTGNAISEAGTTISDFGTWLTTTDHMQGLIDNVHSALDEVDRAFPGFKDTVGNVITGAQTFFQDPFGTLQKATQNITSWFSQSFPGVSNTVSNVIGGIQSFLSDPFAVLRDAVNNIINWFGQNFKLPEIQFPRPKIPYFTVSGGFNLDPANFSLPTIGINWYAKGGIFNGPSVIGLGEAGPEAVVPLSGNRMRPFAEEIADQMQSDTGRTINLTIAIENFNNYDTEKDAERASRILAHKTEAKLKANGLV